MVLINTPIAEPLNQYEPEEYHKIITYLQQKADSSPCIYYWDFNPKFSTRYDLLFDPIHLNVEGQKVVSNEMVKCFNEEIEI